MRRFFFKRRVDYLDQYRTFQWPEKTPADWLMEILALAGLLTMVAWVAYYYPKLPATIPVHISDTAGGEYHEKYLFWIIPLITILVYLAMPFAQHKHWYFRTRLFLRRILTQRQFNWQVRANRFKKMILIWGLFYVMVVETGMAMHTGQGMPSWFFPVFCSVLIAPQVFVFNLPVRSSNETR